MQPNGSSSTLSPPHRAPGGWLAGFIEQTLRRMSAQVGCARTGLWVFDWNDEARALRCLGVHDAAADAVLPGRACETGAGAQQLFDVLTREGHVMVEDASRHLALRLLAENGQTGGRSGALMACALSLNGRLLGAFVCSQTSPGSGWRQRQLIALTKASSAAALSLSRDGGASFTALLERPVGSLA